MAELLPTLRLPRAVSTTGPLEMVCTLTAPFPQALAYELDGLLGAFDEAAAAGAFPAGVGTAWRCRFGALQMREPTVLAWRVDTQALDARAFQLLRSMLGRLRGYGLACATVDVARRDETAELRVVDWPAEGSDANAYPVATLAADERIWSEQGNLSKSRRVLCTFRQPPSNDDVVQLAKAVGPWFRLLEGGAYAMPVGHPATTDSIAGSVSQFDLCTVEVAVDRFLASEAAWASLANIVCADRLRCDLITGIEID